MSGKMVTFRGHAYRSLDPKGRLVLPAEFRDVILSAGTHARVILTNFDGCVVGYSLQEWERIEESFQRINMLNRQLRDFQRFFISGAMEVELDKQGRILIPPHLRTYAGLTREVALAGVGRKFEIWDLERFEEQRRKMEESFDLVMDALAQTECDLRL
ncbi:division/cell wall cluster transcriptional repressor MraZ [Desulfonatronum thiodismutans]|uniref:division/cell wall cluster transcriptional repressor MraZ n=1 Tax=Desulfonatronum thiodismutans TaxID=159290 RepID=UPI0004ABED78|nr:division/cell wall cluster transcriptional repressor MraZ [Desulfonatronum thiodismutans]